MRHIMLMLAEKAHRLSVFTCMVCLAVLLVSMTANVIFRHGLSIGFLKLQDLTLYAFAIFAILSIPVTLAQGRHVRMDFAALRKRGSGRAGRGLISLILFLLPIAILLFAYSLPQFLDSARILEGSGQIGGLGGFFIVKAFVPISALLIALQGVAVFLEPEGHQKSDEAGG